MLLEAAELLEDIDRPLAVEVCTEACSAQLGLADAAGVLAAAERAHELVEPLPDGAPARARRPDARLGALLRRPLRRGRAAPLRGGLDGGHARPARADAALRARWSGSTARARATATRCRDVSETREERRRRPAAVPALPAGLAREPRRAAERGLRRRVRGRSRWRASSTCGCPRTQSLLVLAAITARRGAEAECVAFAEEVQDAARGGRSRRLSRLARALARPARSRPLPISTTRSASSTRPRGPRGVRDPLARDRPVLRSWPRCTPESGTRRARRRRSTRSRVRSSRRARSRRRPRPGRAACSPRRMSFERRFEEAFALHEQSDDRWSLARTHLAFGERLRRAGRKLDAGSSFARARDLRGPGR